MTYVLCISTRYISLLNITDILRRQQRGRLSMQWDRVSDWCQGQQWDFGIQRGSQTRRLQGSDRWEVLGYWADGLGTEGWERNRYI